MPGGGVVAQPVSSFSGPNSSKSSICWVNGCAPKRGLGLLLVGTLNDPLLCPGGGTTLFTPTSATVPWTPPCSRRDPSFASGPRLTLSLMIGSLYADGSPAGGGPK